MTETSHARAKAPSARILRAPVRVLGREQEIARLAEAVKRADHATVSVSIEGAAGIGKTALIELLLREFVPSDRLVFCGRGNPLQRDQPFSPLLAMLRQIGEAEAEHAASGPQQPIPVVPSVIHELATGPAGRQEPSIYGFAADLRLRALDAFCSYLETAASDRPTVVVVEDLHNADAATAVVLREAVVRLRGLPLLVVTTTRPPGSQAIEAELRSIIASSGLHVLLGAIPRPHVADIARDLLGGEPGTKLLHLIDQAHGSPLLLQELIASLRSDGLLMTGDTGTVELTARPSTTTLSASVQRRCAALSSEAVACLHAAAVLGSEFELGELAELTGRRTAQLLPLLNEAVGAGLLTLDGRRPKFTHDLVHESIEASIPPAGAAALHLEASETAQRLGSPAARIVHHIERSGLVTPEALFRWRMAAADEANRREPLVAHRLYSRCVESLQRGSPEWVEIQFRRLEASASAGLLDVAETTAHELIRGGELDDARRFEAVWWLGAVLFLRNQLADSISSLERTSNELVSEPLRARLLAMAAIGHVTSYSPDSERAVQRAMDVAVASHDLTSQALALAASSRYLANEWRFEEAIQAAQRSVELSATDAGQLALRFQPGIFLTFANIDLLRYGDARRSSFDARNIADQIGTIWAESLHALQTALIDVYTGRLDDALAEIDGGLRSAQDTGASLSTTWLSGLEALVAMRVGDVERADRALERCDHGLVAGQTAGLDLIACARALRLQLRGERELAVRHLAEAWEFFEAIGYNSPRLSLLVQLAVLVAGECPHDLHTSIAAFADRWAAAASNPGPSGVRMLLDGAKAQDRGLLMEAVATMRLTNRPLDIADVIACVARLSIAAGWTDTTTAELIDETRELYERCGAASDVRAVAQLERLLTNSTTPPRRGRPRSTTATSGWGSLTATERLVAQEIAAGNANKAIAASLKISVRTVESHVSRILNKLSVSSRLQIALQAEHPATSAASIAVTDASSSPREQSWSETRL
jgi:DNA-binding CsgD family transcriptional regulator/tetratricopeptide (TPR) repeat protein